LWRGLRRKGQAQGELRVDPGDEGLRVWWVSVTAVADEGERHAGYVVLIHDLTERRARERTLRRYRAAFEQSRDAVLFLDDQQFLEGNRAALEMFRVPSAQVLRALQPADLSPEHQPDGSVSRRGIADRLEQAFTRGQAFFRWQHQTLAGGTFPAEVLLSRIGLEEGAVLQAVVRDVTEQESRFEEIRTARNRAQQYFEVARVMMLVLAPDGRVRAINRRGCELLGLTRQEVIGANWLEEFLPPEIRREMTESFAGIMRGEGQLEDYAENEVLVSGGERRLFAFWNTVLRDGEGAVEGVLSSGEDITEKWRYEQQLQWQAQRDALLGIYNRRAFEEFLEREMSRVSRRASRLSLAMLDIDHFKAVNDTYGHLLGDDILKELTELAESRIRREDVLARWGGEEFVVLLPDTGDEGARRVAEDLRQAVAEADFPGPGRVAVSVGVAEMRPGEELKDLTRRVDEALYAAKAAGRDRVVAVGQSQDRAPYAQPAT
jgi:diguanylate cyclase (GGDEF)-like protein/PAS domain S-box-containing protein